VCYTITETCDDILLKVQNIYLINVIIISVYFDIPIINFKLMRTSVEMIPEESLVIRTLKTSNSNYRTYILHIF
jgi:hypothetical protein